MTQEEESALMFVEVNIIEVPDLSALKGGCSSGEVVVGDGGEMPVDEST
jgi:hypothetical protein